jgi:hypothetical protein
MINYNLQYYHEYYDIEGIYHRIDILALEYSGGATLIEISGDNPVVMRHGGSDKDSFESVIIQGQELQFNFFVHNTEIATFEPLFESDYKDYQIKYYVGGYSNSYLEFIGWIDPENMSKEYSTNPPYIEINLSANDGLASLKDIEFRDFDFDTIINGRYLILVIIKWALKYTGIELDFMIQLGTYETTAMTSAECALKKIYVDTKRLAGNLSSKEVGYIVGGTNGGSPFMAYKNIVFPDSPMSCYAVIEAVLLDFNVVFKQYKGKYYITNQHELNSYVFYFDFDTLTQQSREATTNIVDISNYQYKIGVEQQKVKPLRNVRITFKNKDLGGNLPIADLDNWNQDVTWTSDVVLTPSATTGRGWIISESESGINSMYLTLVSDFAVTKVTDNDYIKITFDLWFVTQTPSNKELRMFVKIKQPDGNWGVESMIAFPNGIDRHYESAIDSSFKINSSGNYNVYFRIITADVTNWTVAGGLIGNVKITKIIDAAETDQTDLVTYDRHYEQKFSKNTEVFAIETIFADSNQLSEIGSYLYYSETWAVTQLWNSYGYSEGIKLLDIYSRNILNNRYSYKNYLRCTIIDRLHTIGFNNILTIDSKNYAILAYTNNFKLGELNLELIELLTTIQSYNSIQEVSGNSINGEPISSVNVSVWAGVLHNALNGLEGGLSTHYYHISETIYNGLIDTAAFSIDYTNHRIGIGTISPTGKLDVQSSASDGVITMFGVVASVNATYPGYIYISNTNEINSGYNVNANTLFYINYRGYQGRNTQFRDLNICDGKTNTVLFIDGSTGRIGSGISVPTEKLHIAGGALSCIRNEMSIWLSNNSIGGETDWLQNAYYSSGWKYLLSDEASKIYQANGKIIFSSAVEGVADTSITWVDNLTILANGNIGIGQTNPVTYKLEVTGTGYFSSALYTGANVGTTIFVSGFAGSGWQLGYAGSDATFTVDNLVVRKALTVYELDINKINSVNGGIVVSVANGTCLTVSPEGTTIYFDEDGTNKQIQFQADDYIRAQIWTGRGVASYVGHVISVTHSATLGSAYIVCTTISGTPWNGMELVQIGNSTDVDRQNLIYITASDTNNPYIDMLAGVDAGSFSGKQKLRIGNLTGITDVAFGGALSGYGLYANNMYLKGKIIVTEGSGFTNILNPSLWVVGTTMGQPGFLEKGDLAENSIIMGVGPKGNIVPLWKGISLYPDEAWDGGWEANVPFINGNKTYRYAVFVKKSVSLTDGTIYFGCDYVISLDEESSASPAYFWYGDLPVIDRWYLLIGYVYPYNHSDLISYGGIYDVTTGEKVISCTDFKWETEGEILNGLHIIWQYGCVNNNTEIYYYGPRVEIVDGSEPSIESLMNKSAILNPATVLPPVGTGLFISSSYMGYYTASAWKTYIDNAGNMILGDYAGGNAGLSWNQSGATLSIRGAITATSGVIGGFTIDPTEGLYAGTGATRVQMKAGSGFWAGATAIGDAPFSVTNAGVLHSISGDIGGWTINSVYLAKDTGTAGTSAGMAPSDYPFYAGATYANRATAPFRVTNAGGVFMSSLDVQSAASGDYIKISTINNNIICHNSGGNYAKIDVSGNSGFYTANDSETYNASLINYQFKISYDYPTSGVQLFQINTNIGSTIYMKFFDLPYYGDLDEGDGTGEGFKILYVHRLTGRIAREAT